MVSVHGWERFLEDQSKITRFIVNSYLNNRLVHAYILEGAKGIGKLSFAKNFAKMLLCESDDRICGSCRSCQLIESEKHVNVYMIRPEGNSIKKEQIQALQAEFSKKAAENAPKVYIIEDAEKMSVSAANSLLKFLEEPMKNTYALLLTENKEMLLPTIRSRAVVLTFTPMSREKLIEQYKSVGIHQYASILASLTQSLNEGIRWSESEQFSSVVSLVLKTEECLLKMKMDPSIILIQNPEIFKNREFQLLYLNLLIIYYKDVLKIKLGKNDDLSFEAYKTSLCESSEVNTISDCLRKIQIILDTEKRLRANANVVLCFDQLFLRMKGGIEGCNMP